MKVSTQDSDGTLAFFHLVAPPMSGPPLHVHTREDELFYLEAALGLHDRAGWRAFSTMTAAELAAALLDRGRQHDVERAASLFAETESAARELGLAGVQRRLTAVAARLDGDGAPGPG